MLSIADKALGLILSLLWPKAWAIFVHFFVPDP